MGKVSHAFPVPPGLLGVVIMREKLIELLKQSQYCSVEEQADYLIAAGLTLPTKCMECKSYDPGFVRPYLGWCNNWESCVRESGYCHRGERKDNGQG